MFSATYLIELTINRHDRTRSRTRSRFRKQWEYSSESSLSRGDEAVAPKWPPARLPLSSRALTIPEPTVPAPPRANTTLSELDMPAAASHTCRGMEDVTRYAGGDAADLCRASGPIQHALKWTLGPQFRPSRGVTEATPAGQQNGPTAIRAHTSYCARYIMRRSNSRWSFVNVCVRALILWPGFRYILIRVNAAI